MFSFDQYDCLVGRAAAIAEVRRHGADVLDFLRECGDLEEYRGMDVLHWLGY